MTFVRRPSIALALVAAGASSWAAQHDQHEGHHPAGSASATTSNPEVASVAHEVRQRLERVRSALLGRAASATLTAQYVFHDGAARAGREPKALLDRDG